MATRTTISLPDDLKARMDEVDQPVNWSAEAAKCFEKLLGEIAARKPKKDMSDIIARLKASKLEGEDESYKLGKKPGEFGLSMSPAIMNWSGLILSSRISLLNMPLMMLACLP